MNPPCPVCLGRTARAMVSFDSVFLYRCPECSHCYTDVQRLAHRETYGPDYFLKLHKNWFANPDIPHFEVLRRRIEALSPGCSVLDVGCGTGNLLRHLARRSPGLTLTGIDLIPNAPEPGIDFIEADFFTYTSPRQFHVVITLHTIEHIEDGRAFLRHLMDLCRPGGLISITTINERSILYRIAGLLRLLGVGSIFRRLYSSHHLNHYNFRSLQRLCELEGLQVVDVIRSNIPLRSVDLHARNPLHFAILGLGVTTAFQLGTLTGETYQQTIVCRKPE